VNEDRDDGGQINLVKHRTPINPFINVPLVCPLDALLLTQNGRSLSCSNHHVYDVAASGYINLLLPQFKASREPGDSKAMVSARGRILDDGLFSPLADLVGQIVTRVAGNAKRLILVDAGCGNGYYTAETTRHLQDVNPAMEIIPVGFDISKWAVAAAAKRYPDIAWVVASNKRLPLEQGRADLITSLFGFPMWPEWGRHQSPGQFVIVVDAGARHLIELREIIYPSVSAKEPLVPEAAHENGYELVSEDWARYTRDIAGADVLDDILEMTPHGRKIASAARELVRKLAFLQVSFDLVVRVYRRTQSSFQVDCTVNQVQDFLSGMTFGDGYATPKAGFNYLWAIWRVKAAALLRRSAADFSSKNQALTRKIARPQCRKGFGEPEWAPKPFPSEKAKQIRPSPNLRTLVKMNSSRTPPEMSCHQR
jgi:23S rRNA (guanine745-N1)-methyltransferase